MTVKTNHLDRPFFPRSFPPTKIAYFYLIISSVPQLKSLAPQGEFKPLHALPQG